MTAASPGPTPTPRAPAPPRGFRRVVVATDFCLEGDRAVRRTARLPLSAHGTVIILHVLPANIPLSAVSVVAGASELELDAPRHKLEALLERRGRLDIAVRTRLVARMRLAARNRHQPAHHRSSVALDGHPLRYRVGREHEAVQRVRQPATDRLDDGLLPGPVAKKSFELLRLRQRRERLVLLGGKHPFRDREGIPERPNLLHIDSQLLVLLDRHDAESRFAELAGVEPKLAGVAVQVAAENGPKLAAGGDVSFAIPGKLEPIGPSEFGCGERRLQRGELPGREIERQREERDLPRDERRDRRRNEPGS